MFQKLIKFYEKSLLLVTAKNGKGQKGFLLIWAVIWGKKKWRNLSIASLDILIMCKLEQINQPLWISISLK